ncbi:hypothetical protein AAF712_016439 [Marasmius tenuissimus]|uniref:Uncharacterized protein n=1 Tax=Marasmius tenuissimus TaxID=585030 RepID=A0ABR2Z6Q9_9AGAR
MASSPPHSGTHVDHTGMANSNHQSITGTFNKQSIAGSFNTQQITSGHAKQLDADGDSHTQEPNSEHGKVLSRLQWFYFADDDEWAEDVPIRATRYQDQANNAPLGGGLGSNNPNSSTIARGERAAANTDRGHGSKRGKSWTSWLNWKKEPK